MKPSTLTFSAMTLLLLSSFFSQVQPCNAAGEVRLSLARLVRIRYAFKATTFQGRFDEAMQNARDGDVEPMDDLMTEYHYNVTDILKRLKPFVNDPNDDVKYTIVRACGYVPFNPQAVTILTKMIPDNSVRIPAIDIYYYNYACRQIVEKGGAPLKYALFRAAFKDRYTTNGYLLLSCYKKDPTILRFLERRRKTLKIAKVWKNPMESPEKTAANQTPVAPRDTTAEALSLDLALTQWGDADALARIKGALAGRQPGVLLSLLRYLKFVTNKTVLLKTVELLKDRDKAKDIRSVDNNSVIVYSRLCDEALVALYQRAKLPVIKKSTFPRFTPLFTDQELEEAYQRLKVVFNAETKD